MVHHHYDFVLVVLSYAVSVLGSFTALKIGAGLRLLHDRRARITGLLTASLVMGVGAIWSMHFIAMLACRVPVPVSYDPTLTALSAVVAVLACMVGLWLTSSGKVSTLNLVTAGTYMGVGVSAMHYMGMAAMRMPAVTDYNGGIVALSVVVGIIASIAALYLAPRRLSGMKTFASALLMGVAVCGMHYTGMAAARFVPDGQAAMPATSTAATGLGPQYLGVIVFSVITGLLALVLATRVRRVGRRVLDI